jgi:hypothetical protein
VSQTESTRVIVAFVISGNDVFRVTADSIVQGEPGATDDAFEGIAKLKAAAVLMQLTNEHRQRPQDLRRMAREIAAEGMRILAEASEPARSLTASV